MTEYIVRWEIELDADSPQDAAREALLIHRDPSSIATVFHVIDEAGHTHEIDLDPDADALGPHTKG